MVNARLEDANRWMAESRARMATLAMRAGEAVREATGGELVVEQLAATDPAALKALLAVRDLVAPESSNALLGMVTRIDSEDGSGINVAKKLARVRDSADLLWIKQGKVFGLFTSDEWAAMKAAAVAGNLTMVSNTLLAKLSKRARRNGTIISSAERLLEWGQARVEAGEAKQAGTHRARVWSRPDSGRSLLQ
jgi:hypothetical protein